MNKEQSITYYNPYTDKEEKEFVYGENAIKWLYNSNTGKLLSNILKMPFISKFYGMTQSTKHSSLKVNNFIKQYNINISEYEAPENNDFESFNHFFIRKFKENKRHFCEEENLLPAFCEGRYVGFNNHSEDTTFPVKGNFLKREDFLMKKQYNDIFNNGPLVIARLCPVDYHRFHFPLDGEIIDKYKIFGGLDSVNPIALSSVPSILVSNYREVTIIDTKKFGKLAYIEVGATCVGKVIQTHNEKTFKKGDEKGYFLFGGSTVVVLGEPNIWSVSETIDQYTKKNKEVFIKLGDPIAKLT
jgi:phosphatidylserine decarboxylase